MSFRRHLLLVIAALVLWGQDAAKAGMLTPQFGNVEEEDWTEVPPDEYPDARAIILFDEGFFELGWEKTYLNRHIRIKIFDKSVIDDVANIEIPLFDGFKIEELEAHTITPDGRTIDIEDTYEKRVDNVDVMAFAFPAVENGCIIEYQYRIRRDWPGTGIWYLQHELFTKRSVYIVTGFRWFSPVGNNIPDSVHAVYMSTDEQRMFILNLTDLAPAKEEPLMGARHANIAWVGHWPSSISGRYSDFGWNDMGDIVEEWIDSSVADNRTEIRRIADSICAGLENDFEAVRRLYDFVSSRILTVDEQEQAENITAILASGVGTAYEKNMLFIELLKSLDIPARYLYIGTRKKIGKLNLSIRSMAQFDRVVCHLDLDTVAYVLDPATRCATFPYPDTDDLVSQGLLIDGRQSRIINLRHPSRTSGTDLASYVHIADDGSAICSTTVIVKGYAMTNWCRKQTDSISAREFLEDRLEKLNIPYKITDIQIAFQDEKDRLLVEFVLDLTDFATVVDSNLLLPLCLLPVADNPFTSDRRMFPVDFTYTFSSKHQIQIYLPDGMEAEDIPPDVRKRIQGGLFERRTMADGSQIIVKTFLEIKKPTFPADMYGSVKELYDIMSSATHDRALAAISPPGSR